MDDAGNILVRRYSKSAVYVKSTATSPNEETAIGAEVLKSPNQSLDHDKVMKVRKIEFYDVFQKTYFETLSCLSVGFWNMFFSKFILFSYPQIFDMKKFQSNVNRELSRAYPDRRRLETQCLSALSFVKSENDILDCPIWVLIVNVVAMDMLKSKLPPGKH